MSIINTLRDLFKSSPSTDDPEDDTAGETVTLQSLSQPYPTPSRNRRQRGIPDTIETYYVSTAVLRETQRYIEEHGQRGQEAYVFWAGAAIEHEAYITTCVYPTANVHHGGVKVPLDTMTDINLALRDRDQVILAQAHSHPGKALHSPVDEERAVSFHDGFASIIVPDFGETPIYDLRDCGVYIYTADSDWRLLDDAEIEKRFTIEETVLEV